MTESKGRPPAKDRPSPESRSTAASLAADGVADPYRNNDSRKKMWDRCPGCALPIDEQGGLIEPGLWQWCDIHQCHGTTQCGTRCKQAAMSADGYCPVHGAAS